MRAVLGQLPCGDPDILGSAVVSEDGLVIASALPEGYDGQRVSAVTAALSSIVNRAAQQIALGEVQRMMPFAEKGGVILCSGKKASLAVLTRSSAKIGLVLMDLMEAVDKLEDVLGY
jgi:predicted regulator of Ras-like GTPase activity (Roadblock/LC7/MglB family)